VQRSPVQGVVRRVVLKQRSEDWEPGVRVVRVAGAAAHGMAIAPAVETAVSEGSVVCAETKVEAVLQGTTAAPVAAGEQAPTELKPVPVSP
jgi:hypothetical protein